jgi:WD40 repeat protein
LSDGRLSLWNMRTGIQERILSRITGYGFGDLNVGPPSGIVLAGKATRALVWNETLLYVWDFGFNICVRSLLVKDARDADITPDGKHVVFLNGLAVSQWTPDDGESIIIGKYDGDPPRNVAISQDGQHVLSSGGDRAVYEWSLDFNHSLDSPYPLKGHSGWSNSWWPESRDKPSAIKFVGRKEAIVTTGDGSIFLLRIGEKELERFEGKHNAHINGVLVTNDGKFVVTSSNDLKIMIWLLETRQLVNVFDTHPGYIEQLSESSLNGLLTTYDGILKVVSLLDGSLLAAFKGDKTIISCAADAELEWIVACDQGGRMHFLHFESKP